MEIIIADGEFCKMVDEKTAVTKDGRIFKMKNGVLKQIINKPLKTGYTQYTISGKVKLLHRLVLETFIGPCPSKHEACHNDGNRTNNHIDNLRWDTHSNNNKDKIEHGTSARDRVINDEHNFQILNTKDVEEIIELLIENKTTIDNIAIKYGVSRCTINDINYGKNWRHFTNDLVDSFPIKTERVHANNWKLNYKIADEIRQYKKENPTISNKTISDMYDVSRKTVDNIVNNKCWISNKLEEKLINDIYMSCEDTNND